MYQHIVVSTVIWRLTVGRLEIDVMGMKFVQSNVQSTFLQYGRSQNNSKRNFRTFPASASFQCGGGSATLTNSRTVVNESKWLWIGTQKTIRRHFQKSFLPIEALKARTKMKTTSLMENNRNRDQGRWTNLVRNKGPFQKPSFFRRFVVAVRFIEE